MKISSIVFLKAFIYAYGETVPTNSASSLALATASCGISPSSVLAPNRWGGKPGARRALTSTLTVTNETVPVLKARRATIPAEAG
jgi:hypothetical protein